MKKRERDVLVDVYTRLVDHITDIKDKQPWDNMAMLSRIETALSTLLMDDLAEKNKVIHCPRNIYRGNYPTLECANVLHDYICPVHGLIREAIPKDE